jgi:hypothetical protein
MEQRRSAVICSRSPSIVRCWFGKGRHYRAPSPDDLRHLALSDIPTRVITARTEAISNELTGSTMPVIFVVPEDHL